MDRMTDAQMKRRGERITDEKQEMTFPTNTKELHHESGRKVMCVSEVVTLPHYIKFSVLSVIKYTSEEGKTYIFLWIKQSLAFVRNRFITRLWEKAVQKRPIMQMKNENGMAENAACRVLGCLAQQHPANLVYPWLQEPSHHHLDNLTDKSKVIIWSSLHYSSQKIFRGITLLPLKE